MKKIRKVYHSFLLGLQNSMIYKFNFYLGLISAFLPLMIQYFLWTAIFNNSKSSTVYGYTYKQMLLYSILAVIVSKFLAVDAYDVIEEIKNGGFSKYLIRPMSYLSYRISCLVGQKSFTMLLMLIITFIVIAALKSFFGFSVEFMSIILFILSLILALFINILITLSLCAAAFWISEASGLVFLLGIVVNIVSGGIFPLDIFGKTLQTIFSFLPFQYTTYFSVNILTGRMNMPNILNGLAIQVLWVVVMFIVTKVVWSRGTKIYTAVGG